MDELGKVKRVIERQAPVGEVLLVLDATTGQNGLTQARIFAEVVDVTGIVLTKLDGSAKGGIVVQVQRELGVPVKLVGLGEGVDDLAPFDAEVFVDALLGAGVTGVMTPKLAMEERVLGRTERPVSVVGLGTWQLGGGLGRGQRAGGPRRCWRPRSRPASPSSTPPTCTATAAASS